MDKQQLIEALKQVGLAIDLDYGNAVDEAKSDRQATIAENAGLKKAGIIRQAIELVEAYY